MWYADTYVYYLCAFYLVLIFSAMGKHLMVHGDGVKDIAFEVEDCVGLYKVQCLISYVIYLFFSVRVLFMSANSFIFV